MKIQNRECVICGEIEGRDATPYELAFMVSPLKFIRHKDANGKPTGKHICTNCLSREHNRKRNGWKEKRWEKKHDTKNRS